MEPLTGRDAVEALGLAARLGNTNARFDSRRLNMALRSRAGRLRVMAGMALRVVVPARFHVMRSSRPPGTPPGRVPRRSPGDPAPDRPRLSPVAETRSERFPWAAGLFEAIGTVTISGGRARLGLSTTDHELVSRFHEVVEVGKVYGPYPNRSGRDESIRKPFYLWIVERDDAIRLGRRFYPWLGDVRRERLDAIQAFHLNKRAA